MCTGMQRATGQIFPKHPAGEDSGEGCELRLLGCSSRQSKLSGHYQKPSILIAIAKLAF